MRRLDRSVRLTLRIGYGTVLASALLLVGVLVRGDTLPESSGPANASVRVWIDTAFFSPGETDILKDIVANSSGLMVSGFLAQHPKLRPCCSDTRPTHAPVPSQSAGCAMPCSCVWLQRPAGAYVLSPPIDTNIPLTSTPAQCGAARSRRQLGLQRLALPSHVSTRISCWTTPANMRQLQATRQHHKKHHLLCLRPVAGSLNAGSHPPSVPALQCRAERPPGVDRRDADLLPLP
jgi:hypothetical protein